MPSRLEPGRRTGEGAHNGNSLYPTPQPNALYLNEDSYILVSTNTLLHLVLTERSVPDRLMAADLYVCIIFFGTFSFIVSRTYGKSNSSLHLKLK